MKNTRTYLKILTIALLTANIHSANGQSAASDSAITRNVVVEREFQPIIQSAGKINVKPRQVATTVEPVEVEYSEYSGILDNAYNLSTLGSSDIRFNHPQPANGHILLGGGYPLTKLDFGYDISTRDGSYLQLWAKHNGLWGMRSDAVSNIGVAFAHNFPVTQLYFAVTGDHRYFTRYGRYYDGDGKMRKHYSQLTKDDKQHLFMADALVGIRGDLGNIHYRLQTGYTSFILPSKLVEHTIPTYLNAWFLINEEQKAGLNFEMRNFLYGVDASMNIPSSEYNNIHAFHIEPFYSYQNSKIDIHAGVNFDINSGKGQLMTGSKDLSFAPSPNVKVEYKVVPDLLAIYLNAKGQFAHGSVYEYMNENAYRHVTSAIVTKHTNAYTPVDARLGLKIRPVSTLLLDIHGGYAHLRNQFTLIAPDWNLLHSTDSTDLLYCYSNYNRFTVGAEVLYHYQDWVHILIAGHYYHWQQLGLDAPETMYEKGKVYDRCAWDARLRVDVNIDSKWSVYSDNHFNGSRHTLLTDGSAAKMRPFIDVNLGARYNVNRWIYVYAELNNILHRHNDLFYGYQTEGINGQIGFNYQF